MMYRAGRKGKPFSPYFPHRRELSAEKLQAYLPLVQKVVVRLATRKPAQVELEDLVSWGIVGLIDAFKKYDNRKETAFATYAQFRIRGAILDYLRSLDWVPRSTRQKAHLLEQTYRSLEGTLGRPATEEEVAQALGLSLDELQALLSEVGEMVLFHLEDFPLGAERERLKLEGYLEADGADPFRTLLSRERVALVADAISRLPEKERLIITLYYHHELTMKEVGAVQGLTESRVSQLHSQALLRLKGFLQNHLQPGL